MEGLSLLGEAEQRAPETSAPERVCEHRPPVPEYEPGALPKYNAHVTDLDPALGPPSQKFDLLGLEVLAANHRGRAVVLLQPLIDDEPAVAELFGHRRPGIGRWVLDIGIVHPAMSEGEVRFDRLAGVVGVAHDEAADDVHPVAVQVFDGRDGRVVGPAV